MYEILFYTLLITSTLFSFFLIRKKIKTAKWYTKTAVWTGRFVFVLMAIALWTLQGLRWFAPKGSWLHEASHLAEHFFKVGQVDPPDLHSEIMYYGEHPRQYMLLCRDKSRPAPEQDKIVFFVHGGGWHVGSPGLNLYLADMLAKRGYWVFLPAYRLGPKFSYPELMDDMRSAYQMVLDWQKKNNLQDKGIVLGGTSAGGNLAALLLYDPNNWVKRDSSERAAIKGFFSIAGVLNMDDMPDSKIMENFAGKRGSEQFDATNPVCYLPFNSHVPVLCLHGTHDGLVPYQSAASFMKMLEQQQTPVEFHRIEGGTHVSVAGRWYYNRDNYHQQEEIITAWLDKL